jgi:hypothetical protein
MAQIRTEAVPHPMTLHDAMGHSASLKSLRARLADSERRLHAILPLLPPGLVPAVQPGPVDDKGWTLLVANAAVAAKLRNLQPRIEQALRNAGWQVSATRIQLQPKAGLQR